MKNQKEFEKFKKAMQTLKVVYVTDPGLRLTKKGKD